MTNFQAVNRNSSNKGEFITLYYLQLLIWCIRFKYIFTILVYAKGKKKMAIFFKCREMFLLENNLVTGYLISCLQKIISLYLWLRVLISRRAYQLTIGIIFHPMKYE